MMPERNQAPSSQPCLSQWSRASVRHRDRILLSGFALLAAVVLSGAAWGQIPADYPKPLIHTPADHPADRVMLIAVDGLRAVDAANFVQAHPASALAELTRRGVTYTNAHVPWPDPAAALMALASGGSPISTGIFSSQGYDRALKADGALCAEQPSVLVLAAMPLSPQNGCAGVAPHRLVKVNTIFDLVHEAGGRTAWADSNAAYADLLRGSSGTALDEVFIARQASEAKDTTAAAETQDRAIVDAVVAWIGSGSTAPRLSGFALRGVEAAQTSMTMAPYAAKGMAGTAKRAPLEDADAQIGRVIAALKAAHLFDSTWIVLTSRHGFVSDVANLRPIAAARVEQVAQQAAGAELAHVVVGTAAMIWLRTPAKTAAVVNAYRARMLDLGIGAIDSGEKLKLVMNTANEDSRMPDVILEPQAGVLWSRGGRWPDHLGGFSDDENHVPMLIAGRQLTGRIDKTPVPTGQLAPLILRILGMEKFGLQALHEEHVPALPGIF